MKLLLSTDGRAYPWLRAVAVVITAYFLIATSSPGPAFSLRPCMDGISPPTAVLHVGAPITLDASVPSCNGYDGIVSGITLPFNVRLASEDDASSCHYYDVAISQLPSAIAPPTFKGPYESMTEDLQVSLNLAKASEPGCQFGLNIEVHPSSSETTAENGLRRIDWSAPLTMVRTLSFPQIQFCSGALGGTLRGSINCRDAWSATLTSP